MSEPTRKLKTWWWAYYNSDMWPHSEGYPGIASFSRTVWRLSRKFRREGYKAGYEAAKRRAREGKQL